MKAATQLKRVWLPTALAIVLPASAQADLIVNGGFESGLAGWTTVDQIGSDGTFNSQSGTTSPANGEPVAPPSSGTFAAMTDAFGPGSHLLYQDFVVPTGVLGASISFSLFLNNGAIDFFTPAPGVGLDFSTPALNQQARVDIMKNSVSPFSVDASDILGNLFQTAPGDALVSGYTPFVIDVTALLQAHAGDTLRLRFAEVDNVNVFNLGVDGVGIDVDVPEPASWAMLSGALCLGVGLLHRHW
jgi:hypothetical protein